MNPDDLIAAFRELHDDEIRIDRTRDGDAEVVRLVPSWNKSAVRRFKALAADAAALFNPGPGDPETLWLRFVLDHAPELGEDRHHHGPASLGYAEHQDDGTKRRVPFIAQTLPNAASASALVVRRCRPLIEQDGLVERAQSGVADALARAVIHTSTLPVDRHPSTQDTEPRRRPKRTDADKARDEGSIAAYLADHPDATRDQVSAATGVAPAHVSASKAWRAHKAQQNEVRKANRARGAGGISEDAD